MTVSGEKGLGRIERGDPREVWPNEAADFTPWLSEHILELGDALGMDLEVQAQEAPVGAFSLDLLVREAGTNRTVIIENQLERTDHNHLGQLLAYASGFDADVIVWIARDFREEHRQAIDWLNQRTDQKTDFFGIAVEIWKIDASRPAAHFRLVAAPNTWRRDAAESKNMGVASERNQRYAAFFGRLMTRLREAGHTRARKAQPQSWYGFSIGHGSRAHVVVAFRQGDRASVGLYIDFGDKDRNEALFDSLHMQKDSVEAELNASLDWLRQEQHNSCRIDIFRDGTIDDDQESLRALEDWMFEWFVKFKTVFGPRLDEAAK